MISSVPLKGMIGKKHSDYALSHLLWCRSQEVNYKILSRRYRDSSLLHTLYVGVSDPCWRCNGAKLTITHIWCECTPLYDFWSKVVKLIKLITGLEIPNHPSSLFLSMIPGQLNTLKKSIIPFLLIAARAVICRLWRNSRPLSISEWFTIIHYLHRLKEER